MVGCLGWGFLWMVLFTLLGSLFMSVLGDTGAMIGFILSIAIVVYYQRRRKRKATVAA